MCAGGECGCKGEYVDVGAGECVDVEEAGAASEAGAGVQNRRSFIRPLAIISVLHE